MFRASARFFVSIGNSPTVWRPILANPFIFLLFFWNFFDYFAQISCFWRACYTIIFKVWENAHLYAACPLLWMYR